MDVFWSNFITAFSLALIPIVVPVVIAWVKLILAKATAALESWNPSFAQVLEDGAKLAVTAAEQAGIAKLITEKKEYAIEVLQMYLTAHGCPNIDVELIAAAIEAAVNDAAFEHEPKTQKAK